MPVDRTRTWCTAAFLIGAFGALALAQDRAERFDGSGSLAALTAEVRQLRLTIEELAKGQTQLAKDQTQTQALAVYLSVQQSRILQVSTRLDATRADLEKAASRSRELTTALAGAEERFPQATGPEQRAIEEALRTLKREQEETDLQHRQAASREAELFQMLQLEEARWTDLINRLDQVIEK